MHLHVHVIELYTQLTQETNCKIRHSHSAVAQDSSLLGRDAASLGEWFIMF